MQAAPNTVVKITYELRTEPTGPVQDSATLENPFSFLFGHNNVLEKFEASIGGLVAGNQFHFTLSPEEGYGLYIEEAVQKLPKAVFSHEGRVQEEMLFVGNIIPLQDQDGNPFQGRVAAIGEEDVTVDLNHPFAGKTLHFSGEVLDVRAAQKEEIAHGHSHDGHHHH